MFTRIAGTTRIAASGRSLGEPAEPGGRSRRCQLRQTPPASAGGEVVGVAFERQPELERSSTEASRPAAWSPATSPAATVAAEEPSPRSSGMRLTNLKR